MLPSLRSSKTEGQANFVNPGLLLFNVGFDAELTPKLRLIANVNYLRFHHTETLQRLLFQGDDRQGDRARLSASASSTGRRSTTTSSITGGVSVFMPAAGFKQILTDKAAVYAVRGRDADLLTARLS